MMRRIKNRVLTLVRSKEVDQVLNELLCIPSRRLINPLFSLLYSEEQMVRWKAVTLIGQIVARLAEEDIESARVIMRRLMWNLNDESGGIGWGSPEAMGEILANHNRLAEEYTHILRSYTDENANFLEHPMLQRGLMWAIARVALSWPWRMKQVPPRLIPYLSSPDPHVKGLACWAFGMIGTQATGDALNELLGDKTEIQIYQNQRINNRRVFELASEALKRTDPSE